MTENKADELDELYKRMANCSTELIVQETYFTAWQQMAGLMPNLMVKMQKDNLAKVEKLTKLLIDIQKGDPAKAESCAKSLIEIQKNYLSETEKCAKLLNECLDGMYAYYSAVNNYLEAEGNYDDAAHALLNRDSAGKEVIDHEKESKAD
ncbi:MAG: hypothetical protein PUF17_07260 [Lactimicrobium massiliense]|nr:hypothetical protein [Lactimicrobium massiliense]MDD6560753.1 hypothetical protein [Lactimicrobium massiliense]